MKFVTVFGFFAAIVFNGFNFGQAVTVAEAQTALAQLITNLANVGGPPLGAATDNSNAFNDPYRSYDTMEELTKAAQIRFGLYVDYYKQVDYYKNKGSEQEHERLETALSTYEKAFTDGTDYPLKSEIADVKKNMAKRKHLIRFWKN